MCRYHGKFMMNLSYLADAFITTINSHQLSIEEEPAQRKFASVYSKPKLSLLCFCASSEKNFSYPYPETDLIVTGSLANDYNLRIPALKKQLGDRPLPATTITPVMAVHDTAPVQRLSEPAPRCSIMNCFPATFNLTVSRRFSMSLLDAFTAIDATNLCPRHVSTWIQRPFRHSIYSYAQLCTLPAQILAYISCSRAKGQLAASPLETDDAYTLQRHTESTVYLRRLAALDNILPRTCRSSSYCFS